MYTPTTITLLPSPQGACIGSVASFTVGAESTMAPTFTWRFKSAVIPLKTNSAAHSATPTINPAASGE